ncbi:MAG: DUF2284 domain-containing protein [Desulfobacterales bacterium]|nr:DUF2284 domain-containing protein [Desulfobacteraceae bacterium]MBT7086574.1 DUF2284 domain-containing protein [Desulfobacterales bacterium]MBT7695845.1 DUF2284 domain-containing protein [Desulfobacterales bacterium]
MSNKKPKKVKIFTEAELEKDLESYRKMAMELGATDAKVIPADEVYIDNRVRIKCTIPKCPEYGSSAHCPPHAPGPDEMRDLVGAYKKALLVKLELHPATVTLEDVDITDDNEDLAVNKSLQELLNSYRKINDILTDIESQSFYDGHYLATSFSAGSCHAVLCNYQDCKVLNNEPCRFALRSRPSMEASCIDAYKTVAAAGWDIYPVGSDCKADDVPHGTLAGVVFVD